MPNTAVSTDPTSQVSEQPNLMIQFLRTRDTPCPRCDYNLRGLISNNCPECGDELTLQVGLVEPRLAAYITLLVICSVGLGGSALLTGLALYSGAPLRFWDRVPGLLILAQLILTAIALPAFLYQRQKIRRWNTFHQWYLALFMLGIVLACSITIVVKVN